ncbi:integrator complex subunit 10 [Chrysoperla carnea]|uniref:integrator complex subunit 10 n=1 Tax=Chrysoperla carnea TaxID=189513 RepID=UPI001D08E3BC|nr:integrator complex subunit 10 [Chrysoperla carnea]
MIVEEPKVDSLSDEDYVIFKAKYALKTDPILAKTWMITAKTLYPNNFSVQFEAYLVEKNAKNIKDAAKSLSEIVSSFQQHSELWKEIDAMTSALRLDHDSLDKDNKFLCDMFKYIPSDIQHQILLLTADRCEDTMEHCRLLLLLLEKFPHTISTHAPKLVDTLMTAEKHSHFGNQPINPYRRLLVCDLLTLLGLSNAKIDLPAKLMYKLLNKAIEYYLCCIAAPTSVETEPGDMPWNKLFNVLELTGRILGWDPSLTSFDQNWNKENYWYKFSSFFKTHKTMLVDDVIIKQIIYSSTLFFLYCLHEYTALSQNSTQFTLVEAFTDASLPRVVMETTKSSKRRKIEEDINQPILTIDKPASNTALTNFIMAANCWEMLHSSEIIQREFSKLTSNLKLEQSLNNFILDFAMYKGHYEDALLRLQEDRPVEPIAVLTRNLRIASILFFQKYYGQCFDQIYAIIKTLQRNQMGVLSQNLTVGGIQRHLHFLPLNYLTVVQYCVRLIICGIKDSINKNSINKIPVFNDLALGCLLVLIQLDWPQQEDILPIITSTITQRGTFHYPLLQKHVVNVDILEELMYLWTDQGGNAVLDIFLTPQSLSNQRRIGTRGADKGVKEDFKQAMRRQVIRSNDPIDQVVTNFILGERVHISQCLG